MKLSIRCIIVSLLLISYNALADMTVHMYLTENNKDIGTITVEDSPRGLVLTPSLHDLPPGKHGFHVHENASCDQKGEAAGGHLDPQHTGKHLGPYNNKGHLGDLPVLDVSADGTATQSVVAPRLKMKDIKNRSLMIHEGGDNYSDVPKKLGGGGKRIACGVVAE